MLYHYFWGESQRAIRCSVAYSVLYEYIDGTETCASNTGDAIVCLYTVVFCEGPKGHLVECVRALLTSASRVGRALG